LKFKDAHSEAYLAIENGELMAQVFEETEQQLIGIEDRELPEPLRGLPQPGSRALGRV
jgi:hypothetical protein